MAFGGSFLSLFTGIIHTAFYQWRSGLGARSDWFVHEAGTLPYVLGKFEPKLSKALHYVRNRGAEPSEP
jgi:hypothetical protein